MTWQNTLSGWIATAANLIFAPLENAFPPLAGVASTIVSGFAKNEANAILDVVKGFTTDMGSGKTWEESFTGALNRLATDEMQVITEEGKAFVHMFIHKSKPKA